MLTTLARLAAVLASFIAGGVTTEFCSVAEAANLASQETQHVVGANSLQPATSAPICDAARQARSRNSPAAPGLEVRCRLLEGVHSTADTASDPNAAVHRRVDIAPIGAGSDTAQVSADRLKRIPDVRGMTYDKATEVLKQAGYLPFPRLLDTTDPSVPIGRVSVTVPTAGTVRAGGRVEFRIPRAASRIGTGELRLRDFDGHKGFDLDEGRLKEVFSGADVVLREYGRYTGSAGDPAHGFYIEPTDHALIAQPSWPQEIRQSGGVGDHFRFEVCQAAFRVSRVDRVRLRTEYLQGTRGIACVVTSEGKMGVLEVRAGDNMDIDLSPVSARVEPDSLKFEFAVFPGEFFKVLGREESLLPRGPPLAICEAAKLARARNSPAALGLEARCRIKPAQ